jgi:predicted ATPase
MALLDGALELAEELGHPFHLVYAWGVKATGHWERGESAETQRAGERARMLADEHGFAFWSGVSGVWEYAEHVVQTRDAAFVPKVIEASLVAGESGNQGGSTVVLARVAEAVHAAGDLETALALVDMALSVADDTGQIWWDSALHRMRAEILDETARHGLCAELGGHPVSAEEAGREWRMSLEIADARGYPVHGLRAAVGYASLLDRNGRTGEAMATVESWYRRCPEGRDTPVLVAARQVLDDLAGRFR